MKEEFKFMAVIDRLNVNQTPAFLKDGVFDISEYNNGAVYTDLSDALGQNGINIPPTIRKGGMSVKFIKSNDDDNRYVQYRLQRTSFSILKSDWEEVVSVKTTTSRAELDLDISDENGNVLVRFANGHVKVKHFDSADNNESISAILQNVGIDDIPVFDEEEDYEIENIVRYNKLIYKFTSAHKAGEWDSSEVEETNIIAELDIEHPVVVETNLSDADLDISDEDGNVLVHCANGHIRVKNFDSAKTPTQTEDNSTAELQISDPDGNVIAEFQGGHFRTKKFDSRNASGGSTGSSEDYYNYLVGCFERIVCIGDSITAGFTDASFAGSTIGSNTARVTARNWPSYFKRTLGIDVINLGYGSSATTHWRNSTPETEGNNLYCTLDLANIEGTQAYFIMLGWNDTIATGSSADIKASYKDNARTFYGNYNNIVRRLHEYKPKAHIFVFTLARGKANSAYNAAIRYVAGLYPSYCHLIDYSKNTFFDTQFFSNVADGTHYSPLGYNAFGNFVRNLVSKYIYENPTLFKGIPYSADTESIGSIDIQDIRLSSSAIKLPNIGDYATLVAEIIPNSASNKTITWSIISGDTNCIQLFPNVSTMYCTIKALATGSCVIKATDSNGNSRICQVAVNTEVVSVTGMSLSKSTVTMLVGAAEQTIIATITPTNATNKKVFWSLRSGGNDVVTIEANGLTCSITPRGIGTDTIIAVTEDGNYSSECNITIQ